MTIEKPRLDGPALAVAGACLMLVSSPANAGEAAKDRPDPWASVLPRQPAETNGDAPAGADGASVAVEAMATDPSDVDWGTLTTTPDLGRTNQPPAAGAATANAGAAWSQSDKPNGFSAVAVKQPVLPLFDTRVGADFNVAGQGPMPMPLPEKLATGSRLSESSGAAWAAATAPGFGPVWDKTAVEARLDPAQDQGKLGTSISKSIPLDGSATTLLLQGGYNVTDQSALPAWMSAGRSQTSYGADQSAKLQFPTGTSLIAGQSLSAAEDRWLRTVGAEQSLFDGVTVNGTVSQTVSGNLNKSLTAGFKKSW